MVAILKSNMASMAYKTILELNPSPKDYVNMYICTKFDTSVTKRNNLIYLT